MIQILSFKKPENSQWVLATFDVVIHEMGITMRRWKLKKTKNGDIYPCSSSFCEKDENGEDRWGQHVSFEREKFEILRPQIMAELQKFIKI